MAAQKEREKFVYIAKLAEQAERYDGERPSPVPKSRSSAPPRVLRLQQRVSDQSDSWVDTLETSCLFCIFFLAEMVDSMKKVAGLDVDLTVEERNLLSVGYKNVIGARRASWRILSSIEQKEEAKGNEQNARRIKEYRRKVELELSGICSDVMTVIDEHLIPSSAAGESSVFYYKMKGDYYRYLAEFKSGSEKKEAADQSLKAYELEMIPSMLGLMIKASVRSLDAEIDVDDSSLLPPEMSPGQGLTTLDWTRPHLLGLHQGLAASSNAEAELSPTHPIRLGLALNFSVFYYEIMNSPERACQLARQAFDEAISELDTLSEDENEIWLDRNPAEKPTDASAESVLISSECVADAKSMRMLSLL
ncbi:hypothetical protein Taro_019055 [Colocasia esculenta]|uniref:14-3-3 domain-containing protein n=1 Tax=Colocasia esculenta TaxID=4460 RepID=A0A843UVN6_COLES|nr:hypothetical protein [Colocasia esculenta]